MEYEQRIALSLNPHLDFRPVSEIEAESRTEGLEIWPEIPESVQVYTDFKVTNRVRDREEAVVQARGAVNAVFDDPEALESLLFALYVHEHAADGDHDIYERAERFARKVLEELP